MMPDLTPIHLVIPTHTTRHLEMCLASIALQTVAPATITVTCDVIDDAIDRLLSECAQAFGLKIRHVRREHHGIARISQVRNNAIRSLQKAGISTGRILILDGDTGLPPEAIEKHAKLGGNHGLVVASRIMLSEERTRDLIEQHQQGKIVSLDPHADETIALAQEEKRARFHQKMRRLHLAKSHKPKIVGGHFSIRFDLYEKINGCDEEYEGYGQEDDDLGRRAYAAGGDSVVAIAAIPAMHLYHPTRQPTPWNEYPGFERFSRKDWAISCPRGLENPVDQHAIIESEVHATPANANAPAGRS